MTTVRLDCAFCLETFPNAGQRGQHERRRHPGLDVAPSIRRERKSRVYRCPHVLYGWGRCAYERGHDGQHAYEDMEP